MLVYIHANRFIVFAVFHLHSWTSKRVKSSVNFLRHIAIYFAVTILKWTFSLNGFTLCKWIFLNVKLNDHSSLLSDPTCVSNQICVKVWKLSKYESQSCFNILSIFSSFWFTMFKTEFHLTVLIYLCFFFISQVFFGEK